MTGPDLRIAVLSDSREFAGLADEWDELWSRSPSATPFQAHGWLQAWWAAYGDPAGLRVVTVRAQGRLVAAVALALGRSGPVRVLRPVGAGVSDHSDLLLAPEDADRSVPAVSAALRDLPGWDVLDLPEVRPGAAVHRLAAQWPGRRCSTPASTCLELPARPLPELLSDLPGKTAKHTRRKLRRIDEAGVGAVVVAPDEAADAVDELLGFHAAQWAGRGMNPEHGRARFREHLRAAVPPMVSRGQAALVRFQLAGEPVGLRLNLVGRQYLGAYLSGSDPALRREIDVTALHMRHNLDLASAAGVPTLSLLRGVEEYKFRWRPTAVVNERVVLARTGSGRAVVHLVAVRGRAWILPVLRRRMPWLRSVRAAVADLRAR